MLAVVLAVLVMGSDIGPTDSYVKENALLCNSKRNLVKYLEHEDRGEEEFMQMMRGPATCIIKKRAMLAVPLTKTGPVIQVELADGYRVWLHERDFYVPKADVSETLKKGKSR